MEVLLPDGERRKKWKMDGITYYFKAGKLCQCKSRNPRLREGRKKDGRKLVKTSAQEKSIAVFRMMVYLKRYYFQQITGIPVWDMAPGVAGQTRLTKFHHANAEACDERGVANYPASVSRGAVVPSGKCPGGPARVGDLGRLGKPGGPGTVSCIGLAPGGVFL